MPVTLLTKSAYARHRGCDEKAVRRAIVEKRISLIDGRIDPVVADIQWAANTRARVGSGVKGPPEPAAGQPSLLGDQRAGQDEPSAPAGADASYQDLRRRRERADAERAELETAQLAGRLVERRRVESAVFDAFRVLRDRVMAVPRRVAPAVVGLVEVREIELALADELRRALGLAGDDDAAMIPAVARMAEQALA